LSAAAAQQAAARTIVSANAFIEFSRSGNRLYWNTS
jgi:hypothetical protein